ncbi:IS630 family transposase [Natrialbaceae archaeon GCM10025810]|uniref:IS630 family transposase n=1 Tax=Halovalidus salilacus TaxID=3075124 RepID=UPI00360A4E05
MGGKKYFVDLTDEEREELESLLSAGSHSSQKLTKARILLKSDQDWSDPKIADALDCGRATVQRTRLRFTEQRLGVLDRKKPDCIYPRKLDGDAEAHLVALTCSEPPFGRSRWTLHLLAEKLVTLEEGDIDSISHETVRPTLKNELQPHRSKQWVIPPGHNAKFVCRMEDVLVLYQEPYDPDRPVICFDETNKELHTRVHDPLPGVPGAVARTDYTYRRAGTRKLFLVSEPLSGWRHVDVTKKRTKKEFVEQMRQLVDNHYPDAACIRVALFRRQISEVTEVLTHSPYY